MLGQVLFAEIPLADIGSPARVETGWIKVCKDPCKTTGWSKQPRNTVGTLECDANNNNWTLNK